MQVPFHAVKVGQSFIRDGDKFAYIRLSAGKAQARFPKLASKIIREMDADELVHIGKMAEADFALKFLEAYKAQKDWSGGKELRLSFKDEFGFKYRFGVTEQSAFIQELNRDESEVTGWQHFKSVAAMAAEYGLSWVLEQ